MFEEQRNNASDNDRAASARAALPSAGLLVLSAIGRMGGLAVAKPFGVP